MAAAVIIMAVLKLEFIHGISIFSIFIIAGLLLIASAVNLWIIGRRKWGWIFPAQTGAWCVIIFLIFFNLPAIQHKNSKVFAQKLSEVRKPGEKVIMWGDYFASLPFYMNERVMTVGMDMETTFETRENRDGIVYDHVGDITELLKTKNRVFIITSKKRYSDLPPFARVPLYPILETRTTILVSNKAD